MRFLVIAFLLAWPCLATAPLPLAPARAEDPCTRALIALQKGLGVDASEGDEYGKLSPTPTVALTGWKAGRFGKILVFKKTGASWGSSYATMGHDPAGDPRWLYYLLGPEAARALGFRLEGDVLEMPDAAEFQGRLDALDKALVKAGKAPLSTSFYFQAHVSLATYNRRAAEPIMQLPIAGTTFEAKDGGKVEVAGPDDFNHFVHDMSFHTPAIFIPPDLARYQGAITRYQNAFVDHLAQKADALLRPPSPELAALGRKLLDSAIEKAKTEAAKTALQAEDPTAFAQAELRRALIWDLRYPITKRIDGATAYLGTSMVSFAKKLERGEKVSASEDFAPTLQGYLLGGRDAYSLLELSLRPKLKPIPGLGTESRYFKEKYGRDVTLGAFFRGDAIWNELSAFTKSYASDYPEFDPAKPIADYQAKLKLYCEQLNQRRQEIIAIAKTLPR